MRKLMKRGSNGFTLVEIMIVVAIIALLAAIAIPNLLRARISANDALARTTLRAMSTAAESFATDNNGNYPVGVAALTNVTPPWLNTDYCADGTSGFGYACVFAVDAYTLTATATSAQSGNGPFGIATGGVTTGF